MSIYGLFGKPDEDSTIRETSVLNPARPNKWFDPALCEEAIAGLAQYETDAEAMKVIDAATIRSWFRQLHISKAARAKLYYMRETLKGQRQAAMFLDLLRVAANAGWNPDPRKLPVRGSVTDYVRADRKVFDRWTLLVAPNDHRKFQVELQGEAYDVMRAFVIERDENKINEHVGLPARHLLLVSPGNFVVGAWRPKPKKQELRSTHEYRRSIG